MGSRLKVAEVLPDEKDEPRGVLLTALAGRSACAERISGAATGGACAEWLRQGTPVIEVLLADRVLGRRDGIRVDRLSPGWLRVRLPLKRGAPSE